MRASWPPPTMPTVGAPALSAPAPGRRARRCPPRYCMPGQEISATPARARSRAAATVGPPPGDVQHPTAGGDQLPARRRPLRRRTPRHPVDGPGGLEPGDHVAGAGRGRVALGGAHDGDQGVVGADSWARRRCARRGTGQQLREVRGQPGQHHLGLGVAEAHVVLEHPGALGGEHQPGVEHPPVVDAPGAQARRASARRSRSITSSSSAVVDRAAPGGRRPSPRCWGRRRRRRPA